MIIRRHVHIFAALLGVLILGFLTSCADGIFGLKVPARLGSTNISWEGNAVGYGVTVKEETTLSQIPFTTNFQITIFDGEGPIRYHGITDMTDFDDPSWHLGNMTIDYAGKETSFDIEGDEAYPFTVTLADQTGNPVTSATTYEIEIGVENKEGIMPNPFMFRLRVLVNP